MQRLAPNTRLVGRQAPGLSWTACPELVEWVAARIWDRSLTRAARILLLVTRHLSLVTAFTFLLATRHRSLATERAARLLTRAARIFFLLFPIPCSLPLRSRREPSPPKASSPRSPVMEGFFAEMAGWRPARRS